MRTFLAIGMAIFLALGSFVHAAEPVPTPDLQDFDYFDTIPWELPDDAVPMRVAKVHDGDSINLTEPNDTWYEQYRVVGIQAPELKGYREEECFGPESAVFLQTLLPVGTIVWIQQDISDKDPNGRFLRHIFIEDPETGDYYLLSELMVRGGYARERYYAPDDLYRDILIEAQEYAWENPTNMWTCKEWKGLIRDE